MSTAADYPVGSAKRDPVTKAVAVRTNSAVPMDWAVMTVDRGGHFAQHAEVADWPDWPDES